MKKLFQIGVLLIMSFSAVAADDFPGRKIYPKVPYIEIDALYKELDNVVVVDARSNYEYETLRIKNSILIPLTLGSNQFSKKLQTLRDENPGKKIVFYCNGHTCMKSYKAAQRSKIYVGLDNVFAFDAGIFDWAKKYPEQALLLGKELDDTSKLISKENFKKRFLPAEKFIKTANDSVMILDIRDRIERDGFYIFSGHEASISLNGHEREKLEKFFKKVKRAGKPLYVYDMVGKQVRWFQYYIESKGIKEYYFMEGGADAFFKLPLSKFMDS